MQLEVTKYCCAVTPRYSSDNQGRILGEGAGGAHPPSPPEMTYSFLIQLVFCKKKKLIGLLVLK